MYLVQVRRQHHVRSLAEFSEALEAHLNTLHNLCLLHLRLLARSDPADELVHARPAHAGDPKSSSSRAARMRYVVAYGKRAKKQWLVCSAQCIPPDRGNFDGHVDEEPLGILPSRRHRQKKMCVNCCNELSGREQGPFADGEAGNYAAADHAVRPSAGL